MYDWLGKPNFFGPGYWRREENGVLTVGSDEPFGEQREDLLRLTKRVLEIDPSTAKASQEEDRRMIMEEVDKARLTPKPQNL